MWSASISEDDVKQGSLSNCCKTPATPPRPKPNPIPILPPYHRLLGSPRTGGADLLAVLSACATGDKDLLVRDLCIED